MTFTFKTYQEQAMLTNKAEYEASYNCKHAGYGLVTEIGEIVDAFKRQEFYKKPLDLINLKEEVGDMLWYVALGYTGLGRCMDENNLILDSVEEPWENNSTEFLLKKIAHHSSCVFSYYDEECVSIDYDLPRIVTYLHYLALRYNFTLEEACSLNIEKLRKRFPNGFTEYDAINRNKVEELSHFEQRKEETGLEQSPAGSGVSEEESSPAGEPVSYDEGDSGVSSEEIGQPKGV